MALRSFLDARGGRARLFFTIAVCLLFTGCATTKGPPDARDPWEGFNRSVFNFNEKLDDYVLAPTARGYQAVTPEFVDTGVTNFFSNLDDIGIALNNLLQFKFNQAGSDFGRFWVNTTVGILGFFDVASRIGLQKHDEDFGQTLGSWGVTSGPYLVLPFFGPSTVRDGPSLIVDAYTYPITYYPPDVVVATSLYALDVIDTRAGLFALEERFRDLMFDPYVTIRNAWLERRRYLVHDGRPPQKDDLLEELEGFEQGGGEDDLFRELEEMETEE